MGKEAKLGFHQRIPPMGVRNFNFLHASLVIHVAARVFLLDLVELVVQVGFGCNQFRFSSVDNLNRIGSKCSYFRASPFLLGLELDYLISGATE